MRRALELLAVGLILAVAPIPAQAEEKPVKKKAERFVELTPEKAAEGEKLFVQCAACHGPDAEGRVGIAPSLASKSFLEAAGDDLLIKTITAGRMGTTMIAWAGALSGPQIESLVAHLRSKKKTQPADLDESPLKGDIENGEQIFSSICSTCHGRNGGGYMETVSGTGIGRQGFLDAVSNGYLRYIIKHGKSGTQMKSFAKGSKTAVANLSDQEIEDAIAYLRANAW